ncbi:peptidyl-prolyl cis-trans isomerase [Thioclava sp. FR2]|uniref:peptidyl-prolyl cis-trans isomerase n=1 Tax=Thioclava sp. FR2 TaxID=3445780 RepID=UPI003EC0E350
MTKDTEDTPRKKGKGSQIIVYGLMAMLVAGLGGFGITNFSGGATAIGKVGEREITANKYARALQAELNALSAQFGTNMTLTQAQSLGVDRRVLASLVSQAALDNEAQRLGLSVGDSVIADQISQTPAFQGTAGKFDRETYRFALDRANMTESEFEADLRADSARQLLTGAVAGGFVAPQAAVDTFYAWVGERRGFSLLQLTTQDLETQPAEPTDEELKAFYEANIAQFTAPEAKRITYVSLLPEDIAANQAVDDETLRRLYDERISEFVQPEKRLVERLVYPSQEEAEAAKARLDAGESFETLVSDRGLTLDDVDLGDVGKDDLGAAGEAVFALAEPGVVGPLESDFGPALFRMNAILAAQEVTFDEAKPDLALEIQMDAARRTISDQVDAIDDLLAGGASLEDLVKEQGMTLGSIDFAVSDEAPSGIAAYPKFREAAAAIQEGDFPEAVLLDDGGLVALRLEEIVPPTPIPFDDAKTDVTLAYKLDAMTKALSERAIEVKAAVEGGASLGAYGIVSRTANFARESALEGAPPTLAEAVFAMQPGDLRVIEAQGFVGIVRLDEITAAAEEGEDATALKETIALQLEQAIAQDALSLYSDAMSNEAGLTLDQAVINAIHTNFN